MRNSGSAGMRPALALGLLVLLCLNPTYAWARWPADAGMAFVLFFLMVVVPIGASVYLGAVMKYGWLKRNLPQADHIQDQDLARLALKEAVVIFGALIICICGYFWVAHDTADSAIFFIPIAVSFVVHIIMYSRHRRLLYGDAPDKEAEPQPAYDDEQVRKLSLFTPVAFTVIWFIMHVISFAPNSTGFSGSRGHSPDVNPFAVVYLLLALPSLSVGISALVKNRLAQRMLKTNSSIYTDWLVEIAVLEVIVIVTTVVVLGVLTGPYRVNPMATLLVPLLGAICLFVVTFVPHLLVIPGDIKGLAERKRQSAYLKCATVVSLITPAIFALFWCLIGGVPII